MVSVILFSLKHGLDDSSQPMRSEALCNWGNSMVFFIQEFISSSSFLPWFHDLRNFYSLVLLPSSPEVNLSQMLGASLLQFL